MTGDPTTPAEHHIFDIADEPTDLSKEDADKFHRFVAQLVYLSKIYRLYIHINVYFICTFVQQPDTNDYNKLARVMKHLQVTIVLLIVLSIKDKDRNIKWYVDAAFSVKNDISSHTGSLSTMGIGADFDKSSKQKLNTKSSTESELVAVDGVLMQVICTRYFI